MSKVDREDLPYEAASDDAVVAAGVGAAGEVDEASEEGTGPEPAELDKPLVDEVVGVGEEAGGGLAGLVVADDADEEGAEDVETDPVGDVEAVDDFPTEVDDHHDDHLSIYENVDKLWCKRGAKNNILST